MFSSSSSCKKSPPPGVAAIAAIGEPLLAQAEAALARWLLYARPTHEHRLQLRADGGEVPPDDCQEGGGQGPALAALAAIAPH